MEELHGGRGIDGGIDGATFDRHFVGVGFEG